jgi:putative DNA primase/helicase
VSADYFAGLDSDLDNNEIDRRLIEEESADEKPHLNGNGHADRSQLPKLIVDAADPTATAKELAAMLAKSSDFLFNGNGLVRVVVDPDGSPRAIAVTDHAVRVAAHEICNPVKLKRTKKGEQLIPASLSKDIAQIYLNALQDRWNLPKLVGITTAQILEDDGTIRIERGYDKASGLWCHNIPKLNIPERPTEADARAALDRLRYSFRTFPFADGIRARDAELGVDVIDPTTTPGLDESSFLAGLLTSVCRQSLELAPGLLADAPGFSGAGTGKGLLVKAMCMIANGSKPPAFTSGHDAGELDKRLTSALIEARPAVFLDNFNAKELKSDTLASALTESPAMVRPMGHTKTVPLHTRTFISITGNGVEIAEDMARRQIMIRLDAQMEDPEARPFAPGFLELVAASRPALLSDALTIWRWGRQTVLKPGKPIGSFEKWAQWCRDPLLMLDCKDPIERIAEIKANDSRRRALVDFFEVWWAAHSDAVVKANEVAMEVALAIVGDKGITKKDDGTPHWSRQAVAAYIGKCANSRVGGYAFIRLPDGANKRATAQYTLKKEKETQP